MQAGHSGYVTALAVMAPGTSTEVPGLAVLSGSRDLTARVWDVETKDTVRTLSGHKYQVTGVGVVPGGQTATGEMDGTLRVWKAGKAIRTLREHEGAVLCVTVLPNEDILTGARPSGALAHSTDQRIHALRRSMGHGCLCKCRIAVLCGMSSLAGWKLATRMIVLKQQTLFLEA